MVGSVVLILFQFCPCWTLPPLTSRFCFPVKSPASSRPIYSNSWSNSRLSSPAPVADLSVAPSHINYCINRLHNSLVVLHVNYNLEKPRAKRTGMLFGCMYKKQTIKAFFFFFKCRRFGLYTVVCLDQFRVVPVCVWGFYLQVIFSNTWFWDKHSMFLLACWHRFLCRCCFFFVYDVHMNACIPEINQSGREMQGTWLGSN